MLLHRLDHFLQELHESDATDGAEADRRAWRAVAVAIAASYAIDSGVLALFYAVGRVGPAVPLLYFAAGLAQVGVFTLVQRLGLGARARNPFLTEWQMAAGIGIQLAAMWFAPQIKAYFLGVIFVVFSFGALRLSIRAALLLWTSTCLATAAVLVAFPSPAPGVGLNPGMLAGSVVGLGFALILLRCLLLNYFATLLRLRLMRRTENLSAQVRAVQEMASRDRLTGAFNRHAVLPLIEDLIQLALRKGVPGAVALIDLDHFKSINDRRGHIVGDAVLRRVVAAMQACVRPTDKLARYGGEEFLLVMPSTTLVEARDIAERLREAVAAADLQDAAPGLALTISVGVTEIGADDTIDTALGRADRCLYQAKNSGRNRVAWQSPSAVTPA